MDEVKVMNKIINQGGKAMEGNEYYYELKQANQQAYFNFKDFQKYGTTINLLLNQPINMIRYSNIENQNQLSHLEIDTRTGGNDLNINLVGLTIGPFNEIPIQCIKKENLIDIRNIKLNYMKNDKIITKSSDNGYKIFLKIIKYFLIETLNISSDIKLFHDYGKIQELNKDIFDKVIYWIYDVEKDKYEMDTYENFKFDNFQENIKHMNANIYDNIIKLLNKKLIKLINENQTLKINQMETMIERYSKISQLSLNQDDKRTLFIRDYLRTKKMDDSKIYISNKKLEMPEFRIIPKSNIYRIKIDIINPLHPQEYILFEAYSKEGQEIILAKTEIKCQHVIEWYELNKFKIESLNKYNEKVTEFIDKFVLETKELDFVCKICGQILPIKQYVQDGSFDNNTQKFVTAYTPADIPLDEIKEYRKYGLIIKTLDSLINRISLITNTNALVGITFGIKSIILSSSSKKNTLSKSRSI